MQLSTYRTGGIFAFTPWRPRFFWGGVFDADPERTVSTYSIGCIEVVSGSILVYSYRAKLDLSLDIHH